MKYVSIDKVEPGQYLGKTVYSGNGAVLLSADVQLTVYMINTLNRIGVTMLYIKDPTLEDVEIEDVLSEQTKAAVISEMNETFSALRSGKDWSPRKVAASVDQILDEAMSNKETLIQLTDIRTADNAQYVHSVNVCLMSTMIGINMGLNSSQLKELAIGALLHDLGKIDLNSETKLLDITRGHHTWQGFELLKSKREFNLRIAHVALQHHERVDGEGLPRGLTSDDIHIYAKIVAVANTYDNLVNPLNGRGMLPHEACEELMAMSNRELDHEVLIEFTRIISVYPNGSGVRLSTKEAGVVVRQHRGLPSRPVIRIVKDHSGDLEVKEVDLATHTTVFIDSVMI